MNESQEINDVLSRGLLKYLQDASQGDWHGWGPVALAVVGGLVLLALALYLRTRLRYVIGPDHLEVVVLGLVIRRLRLDNIRQVRLRRRRFAERWDNTLLPRHDRLLVLETRRGLLKSFVITPAKRQVFKAKLEQAMARAGESGLSRAGAVAMAGPMPAVGEPVLSENGATREAVGS